MEAGSATEICEFRLEKKGFEGTTTNTEERSESGGQTTSFIVLYLDST